MLKFDGIERVVPAALTINRPRARLRQLVSLN